MGNNPVSWVDPLGLIWVYSDLPPGVQGPPTAYWVEDGGLQSTDFDLLPVFLPEIPAVGKALGLVGDALGNTAKTGADALGNLLPKAKAVKTCPSKEALDAAYPRVKLGKGTRADIFERSKSNDGKVYDPSGVEIKPGEPWQAGHRPGEKFTDAQQRAWNEMMDDETWKSYQRDPDIYRPEKAHTNFGHEHESDW